MKSLYDYAKIIRSKNAGPLYITFDLIFESKEIFAHIKDNLTTEMVACAYKVIKDSISIIPYEKVNSIKITFPRSVISGGINDDDIYGCQKHVPLSKIII